MAAYDGFATISQGSTKIRVECSISVSRGEWSGLFWATAPGLTLQAKPMKIELEDGRVGKIDLVSLEPDGRSGRFTGSGPPPSSLR
jgi:hypothetical protein